MKAYGKKRHECANRKIKGTDMACPCCIPSKTKRKSGTKVYKKAERQKAKKLVKEE
jgi:hypothetical protein